jgi:hypothetical protein
LSIILVSELEKPEVFLDFFEENLPPIRQIQRRRDLKASLFIFFIAPNFSIRHHDPLARRSSLSSSLIEMPCCSPSVSGFVSLKPPYFFAIDFPPWEYLVKKSRTEKLLHGRGRRLTTGNPNVHGGEKP